MEGDRIGHGAPLGPHTSLRGIRIFGYFRWIVSILPIFPSARRILGFVKETKGKACGLRKNGENGIGEHGSNTPSQPQRQASVSDKVGCCVGQMM